MSHLDRIEDWLRLARESGFSGRKLAQRCKLSPSQLRRYVKRRFGRSLQRWLNELRLWEAARLIGTTQLSIKEVAAQANFSGPSRLGHEFNRYFGCRPSDFPPRCRAWESGDLSTMADSPKPLLAELDSKARPWEAAIQILLERSHKPAAPTGRAPTRRSNPGKVRRALRAASPTFSPEI